MENGSSKFLDNALDIYIYIYILYEHTWLMTLLQFIWTLTKDYSTIM